MFKFSLKSKQLSEVTDKELQAIKDVSSGIQFPNVFGGEQRIVIDKLPGNIEDVPTAFQKNGIDYVKAHALKDGIVGALNKMSTDNYKYSIDFSRNLIIRETKRIIPKGPKAGQEEIKKELIKASTLRNLLDEWLKPGFGDEKSKFSNDEIEAGFRKIFPEVKYDDGRKDNIGQFIYDAEYAMDSERQDFEYDQPDLYLDYEDTALDDDELLVSFFDAAANMASDNVIIVTRAPVDILRMSDFPGKGGAKTGIVSCHSPKRKTTTAAGVPMKTGAFYDCAVYEAKNNGAVAYLIPRKAYEEHKDKFNSREFFKDLERESTQGAYPINRLRMRRYFYAPTQTELLVPEEVIYGQNGTNDLFRTVKQFLLSKQSAEVAKIKGDSGVNNIENYILVGGSYADSQTSDLINEFLGIYLRQITYRAPGMTEKSIKKPEDMVTELLKMSKIGGLSLKTYMLKKQIAYEEVKGESPERIAVKITISTGDAVISLPNPPYKTFEKELKSVLDLYGIDLQQYIYNMLYEYFAPTMNNAGTTNFNVEINNKVNPVISCIFIYSLPKNGRYSQEDITKAYRFSKLINLFFDFISLQRFIGSRYIQDTGKASIEANKQLKAQQQQQLTESVNRKRKLISRRG
jgi:hypothetical protein